MGKQLNLNRSGLDHHKQLGKELIPPFQQIGPPIEQIHWLRDLLPEFLWIDALVQHYGQSGAAHMFNEFLSAADRFNSDSKRILDGTVGAFRFIAEDRRQTFVQELGREIAASVIKPFGYVLSLYPKCMMKWMAPELSTGQDSAIIDVRKAILRLVAGKDEYAGFCRALPLNRFFAHDKVRIFSSLTETIEAIKAYPHGDRYRAETFARTTHNMVLQNLAKEDAETFAWARYFWNHNQTIVPCSYE